jgi:hypothetical protein
VFDDLMKANLINDGYFFGVRRLNTLNVHLGNNSLIPAGLKTSQRGKGVYGNRTFKTLTGD